MVESFFGEKKLCEPGRQKLGQEKKIMVQGEACLFGPQKTFRFSNDDDGDDDNDYDDADDDDVHFHSA